MKKIKGEKATRLLIIILTVIIVILLCRDTSSTNYWVDNISFEGYIYNDNGVEIPKSNLSFSLSSDKEHNLEKKSLFSSLTSSSNTLNNLSEMYFRCHNKKNNEFYYFYVDSHHCGGHISISYEPDGPNFNTHSNTSSICEIKNDTINANYKDIDYCEFLGLIQR